MLSNLTDASEEHLRSGATPRQTRRQPGPTKSPTDPKTVPPAPHAFEYKTRDYEGSLTLPRDYAIASKFEATLQGKKFTFTVFDVPEGKNDAYHFRAKDQNGTVYLFVFRPDKEIDFGIVGDPDKRWTFAQKPPPLERDTVKYVANHFEQLSGYTSNSKAPAGILMATVKWQGTYLIDSYEEYLAVVELLKMRGYKFEGVLSEKEFLAEMKDAQDHFPGLIRLRQKKFTKMGKVNDLATLMPASQWDTEKLAGDFKKWIRSEEGAKKSVGPESIRLLEWFAHKQDASFVDYAKYKELVANLQQDGVKIQSMSEPLFERYKTVQYYYRLEALEPKK